jgi:TPR repeat protein
MGENLRMTSIKKRAALKERHRQLHACASEGDVSSMRALAIELLDDFDEEHFNTERKSHIADLMAVLTGTSKHDFSQPPPQKLSASARRDYAMHWMREASLGYDVQASAELAELLFRAGAPFHRASLEAFGRAAELGDTYSMLALGRLCWYGYEGAGPDRTRAEIWLQRARSALEISATGNDVIAADACLELGQMDLLGQGCTVNVDAAIRSWQRAADLGNTMAMTRLGNLYAEGGTLKFDFVQATHWYERAAAAGDSQAPVNLARLEAVRAMRANRDALMSQVEQGDSTAAVRLARHFESGNDGGEANADAAAHWYRVAAQLGHPTGMFETGKRLASHPAEPSRLEAWFWLRLVQREPWSSMKPPISMLAHLETDRLAPRLDASKRQAVDVKVAAVQAGHKLLIEPPAI